MRSIIVTALMAIFLAACSGGGSPSSQTAATQPAAAPSAARAEPARTVEAPAAQSSTSVVAANQDATVGERQFREGVDYELLSPAQPTSTEGDKIEVAEVFMYSCPHCFAFEPYLEQWSKTRADYINFVRIPAAWNSLAELHARAFYTAEILGKGEEMHTPFFREIHVNHNYLDTEDKLADFFGKFGVDKDTFKKTFDSFAVHTKVQRAKDLVMRYRVSGTPGIVVNGKYLTSGSMAGSYERWFAIIDELAAVEWAAKN